jgi:5,5'-dehydrodivanillate O-demethylase oxygenase subunit
MLTVEENERLCRIGPGTPCGDLMRRYWHPIAATSQIVEPITMPIKLLGEDFVLYRDRSGGLGLVEPHCAHRAAGLVYGIPDQNGLRCAYHGWLYDATGQCLEQPYESFVDPSSTYCQRVRIRAHPVQELGGLVWTYLGPDPVPLIPRWEGMIRDDVKREISFAVLDCNWLQSLENSGDGSHSVWTHRELSKYVFERLGRPDLERHGTSAGMGGFPQRTAPVRRPYGYGSQMFPYAGALRDQYQIRVPLDDAHTLHIWYQFYTREHEEGLGIEIPPQPDPASIPFYWVPVPGARGNEWPLMDSNSAQDAAMWVTQGPLTDRSREHLGVGDEHIIKMRQLLEEQISVVEEGGDPLNVFRDPAKNECLSLPWAPFIPYLTPAGLPDRTQNARKYSPIVSQAALKAYGPKTFEEPVH